MSACGSIQVRLLLIKFTERIVLNQIQQAIDQLTWQAIIWWAAPKLLAAIVFPFLGGYIIKVMRRGYTSTSKTLGVIKESRGRKKARNLLYSYKYFLILRASRTELALWCTSGIIMPLMVYGFAFLIYLIPPHEVLFPFLFCAEGLFLAVYFLSLMQRIREPAVYEKKVRAKILKYKKKPWFDEEINKWFVEAGLIEDKK